MPLSRNLKIIIGGCIPSRHDLETVSARNGKTF